MVAADLKKLLTRCFWRSRAQFGLVQQPRRGPCHHSRDPHCHSLDSFDVRATPATVPETCLQKRPARRSPPRYVISV